MAGALLDRFRGAVLEHQERGGDDSDVRAVALELLDAMTGGAITAIQGERAPLALDLSHQVAAAAALSKARPPLGDGGPDFTPFAPIADALGARFPRHGVGSLGHGDDGECDILGGEDCNNGQCRQRNNGRGHACTVVCSALCVWDLRTGGSWTPDAPNLAGAGPDDLVVLADLIAQGGPR
jgi:hypothetical protein